MDLGPVLIDTHAGQSLQSLTMSVKAIELKMVGSTGRSLSLQRG